MDQTEVPSSMSKLPSKSVRVREKVFLLLNLSPIILRDIYIFLKFFLILHITIKVVNCVFLCEIPSSIKEESLISLLETVNTLNLISRKPIFLLCGSVHKTYFFFVKSFISLLLLHIMFSILIVLYSPTSPYGSFPTALLLAISHVQLDCF